MRIEAAAEVAAQELAEVDDVLLGEGFIKAQLNPGLLELLLGGTLAGPFYLGVARQDSRDEKRDGDDAQQHDEAAEYALYYVFEHWAGTSLDGWYRGQ